MKKLLFLSIAAALSLSSIAQGNSGKSKNNGKHHSKHQKKDKKHDSKDGEWRNNDDRYDNDDDDRNENNRDRRWNNQNNQGNNNNSGSAPRKVRDAFYSDYPNADNVRWTKDRGVWTAHFRGAGLFGGNDQSVSYRANGQRLNNNNNNNTTRRRTDQQRRTNDRNTTNTNERKPTIFDKVRNRNN